MTSSKIAAASVLAVALLALWAWALQQGNDGGTNAPLSDGGRNTDFEQQIAELRAELDVARGERFALSAEVDRLRAELDWITPPDALSEEEAVTDSEPDVTKAQASDTEKPQQSSGTGAFDEAMLLAQGMPTGDVSRLRELFESAQMEELYLRDRATREGWINKPRFHRALARVQNRFRDSLSDDDYDRMLYATGEKNRVVLAHLLHGSPAMDAGLRDGDVVLSYNDVRIFQPRDLQRATTTSAPAQLTPMLVLRDGEEIRVFLPAGPIGVQLDAKAMLPSP